MRHGEDMKKRIAIALLATCLWVTSCQKVERADELDLSATSPDATLPPSVPVDDTAGAATETIDTSTSASPVDTAATTTT